MTPTACEPFADFTERILSAVDALKPGEPDIDYETRASHQITYCEHGAPAGTRCFPCDHPEALLALTQERHAKQN